MLSAAIIVVFPICMSFDALSDMLSMTIPNRVSIVLLLTFAVVAPLVGLPASQIAWHIAAGGIVFLACFACFALGAMGGGDAKLLTAASIWFGMNIQLFEFLTYVALLGGLLTIVLISVRNDRWAFVFGHFPFLRHLTDPKQGVPYGVAIGVAGLVFYPQTVFVQYAISLLA